MFHKALFGTSGKVAVSRITRNKPFYKPKQLNSSNSNFNRPDSYDICIKAKAIARSADASTALSYALNQSNNLKSTSKPVLINTILTALSREGQVEKFWDVVAAKVDGNKELWSPQLAATLLNQIAREMETTSSSSEATETLMHKATQVYIEALETINFPEHLHVHNAYLKCISRYQNVPYLMWILNLIAKDQFKDIELDFNGIKDFLPVSDSSLRLAKLLMELKKPVALDCQSLTSILFTLSRSPDGSIQLAESIWSKFQNQIIDKPAHLSLLLVYRNDLSRIFTHRKLIRASSWRERKHARVLEIIKSAGVDLSTDHKFLSVYFEICWNGKMKEKIGEYLEAKPVKTQDKRLLDIIKKAEVTRNGN